jgi:branched-subunit amino acid aminotransferase/4-amino-4-deoxychorismate lyase
MPTSAFACGPFAGLTSLSSSEVLKNLPRAAYTTARANASRRVFDFSGHVARTAASATAMAAAEVPSFSCGPAGDADTLRPLLGASMALAMRALRAAPGSRPDSLKITSLVFWGSDRCESAARALLPSLIGGSMMQFDARAWPRNGGGDDVLVAGANAAAAVDIGAACELLRDSDAPLLITHVCPMAPRRAPPVRLRIAGAPRAAATAKDSTWVTARAALESRQGADTEEIILTSEGSLFEGLQTNFFALNADGVLETAPDGTVLAGTVRGLVLAQAKMAGLDVIFCAPQVSQAARWRGAFICSTSRLVMPVDELVWDASDVAAGLGDGRVTLPRDPLLLKFENRVSAAVDELSEEVVEDGRAYENKNIWATEAVSAISEALSGVTTAKIITINSSSALLAIKTLEGSNLEIQLSVNGATVTTSTSGGSASEGSGGRVFDTLHSALLALSPRYCEHFNNAIVERLNKIIH